MTTPATTSSSLRSPRRGRGPVLCVLDVFSSVRLGIGLLIVLFVYCTVGSAGIIHPTAGVPDFAFWGVGFRHSMVRQHPAFELTEFEWFHTPFFLALITLICLNISVTTVRRIRLCAINAGVWMIHTGIITLSVGSVIYFSTKIEGDTPVARRQVAIQVPGAESASLVAVPGSTAVVQGEQGTYQFQISTIDPEWEILSGQDTGRRVYAVSVFIIPPAGQPFVRQLLDGFPQYTEDVIPGRGRIVKLEEFGGRALVDDSIALALERAPQTHFFVKDSTAVFIRTSGSGAWSQRVVRGAPRYHDVYPEENELWPVPPDKYGRIGIPRSLAIEAKPLSESDDELADVRVAITGYLRYAVERGSWEPGGDELFPLAEISIGDGAQVAQALNLLAFDEAQRQQLSGRMAMEWIESESEMARFRRDPRRRLTVRLPDVGLEEVIEYRTPEERGEEPLPTEAPLIALGESGWSYRVITARDHLRVAGNELIDVLVVHFRTPEGALFRRWVREDATLNRDFAITAPEEPAPLLESDARIETLYEFTPGGPPAMLTIVAGAGDLGVRALFTDQSGELIERRLVQGLATTITQDLIVTLDRFMERAKLVNRPQVVPWTQRNRDADAARSLAMFRVTVEAGEQRESRWVPFQQQVHEEDGKVIRVMSPNWGVEPFTLDDGREIELVVGRERRELPAPVALEDFILTPHVGGFTGSMASIRDWTSELRFGQDSETLRVSTNQPVEHGGMWFFQASWDPPREGAPGEPFGSPGMTYTGLGVGNRRGVHIQLLGCCISVIGMLYAFYVKPILKRRRREAVLVGIDADECCQAALANQEANGSKEGAP